jgi:hypothetical protein
MFLLRVCSKLSIPYYIDMESINVNQGFYHSFLEFQKMYNPLYEVNCSVFS